MSVVLACDLGGSSFRAALVDATGRTVGFASLPGPAVREDAGGGAEVDPEDWWRVLTDAAARLAAAEPARFPEVQAIAICGVTRTQVFVGRDGRALAPAPTWKDLRSEAAARRLAERAGNRHPEAAQLNAYHPLARLVRFRDESPDDFAALAAVLDPKDWLNLRLTGRVASDPVSQARLRAAAAPGPDGGATLFALAGLDEAVIPAMAEPWETVGSVRSGLPPPFDRLAGVPVFCGSNDTWAAVVGLGAMRAGCAYNISGTTEVLGVVGQAPVVAEGLLTVDWRGLWQVGGPSQTGADTVAWLLGLIGRGDTASTGERLDALLAGPRDAEPLLFLPYLQGERVPYWDPTLRGAFLGLNRRHGPTDLAWAVLEGVAFLNRTVLARAEAASGRSVDEIRFGGGAAANAVWRQVKADACGRTVVVGAAEEPGVTGAACLAWTGLGRYASLAEAQERLVRVAARHEPDPARRARYDRLFALFGAAETAVAPLSRALSEIAKLGPAVPATAPRAETVP